MRRQGTMAQSGFKQTHHLFAYPLESNFSGARYNPALSTYVQHNGLPMCEQQSAAVGPSTHKQQAHPISNGTAQNGRHASDIEAANGRRSGSAGSGGMWWTLLDAAKACATSPPDLSLHQPDFVVRCLGTPSASKLFANRRIWSEQQNMRALVPSLSAALSWKHFGRVVGNVWPGSHWSIATSEAFWACSGALLLQDLWLPNWPGCAAGAEGGQGGAGQGLLWGRDGLCLLRRVRLCQVAPCSRTGTHVALCETGPQPCTQQAVSALVPG